MKNEPKANAETRPSDSGETPLSFRSVLEDIANAKEPNGREPDDADWRFHFLEMKRVAALALELGDGNAETNAAVPENTRLLSGVSSDPLSQTPAQSDDVRRQTIEECAKVAEANMHSSVMPGHVGKNIAAEIRALQPQPNGGET